MRVVKKFEEYLKEGIAKKVTSDKQRAENLFLESKRKFVFVKKSVEAMGIDDSNANDYVEYCYNILMFLIRSKMSAKGYTSSGQGAHESEVAFARNMNFTESEIMLLDQLRYFRNGILYYGKRFDKEYAEQIIEFTKKTISKF